MKESRENKMNTVKWDEKFFKESLTHIWVYSRGLLVSTNNRKSRTFMLSGMSSNKFFNIEDNSSVKFEKKVNS